MPEFVSDQVEIGRIVGGLTVVELTICRVKKQGVTEELDGLDLGDESEEEFGTVYEFRLQGHIENSTGHKLSDIKYDLSYYDFAGNFLGFNNSRFLDEDELDAKDYLPIDMRVDLPESMSKCVFNARAKKTGFIGKLFWG